MPQEGIGRTVQSAIYRAGAFGHRPAVPTDGTRLEAAARKVMSKRGFAYVAGSAGGPRVQPNGYYQASPSHYRDNSHGVPESRVA